MSIQISMVKTQESNLESIIKMENDKENSSYIFSNSREEHLEMMRNENIGHFILYSETQDILGFVILVGLKDAADIIELKRIVIERKGQGIGRRAIQQIKNYCFEQLNCSKLWLDVLEWNKRAIYLYQSEGFREEKLLRDAIVIDQKVESLILMSLDKKHWQSQART